MLYLNERRPEAMCSVLYSVLAKSVINRPIVETRCRISLRLFIPNRTLYEIVLKYPATLLLG
jgi:hypothetical protein